jgi:hypothetical protein
MSIILDRRKKSRCWYVCWICLPIQWRQWCQGDNQQCYLPFEYKLETFLWNMAGEETSCEEVAALSEEKRARRCNNKKIIENCPGLCNKDKCPCANSPFPFPLNSSDMTSCEELAALSEKQKANKCKNKARISNCPCICGNDQWCPIKK